MITRNLKRFGFAVRRAKNGTGRTQLRVKEPSV
jgi:hypothetical protein